MGKNTIAITEDLEIYLFIWKTGRDFPLAGLFSYCIQPGWIRLNQEQELHPGLLHGQQALESAWVSLPCFLGALNGNWIRSRSRWDLNWNLDTGRKRLSDGLTCSTTASASAKGDLNGVGDRDMFWSWTGELAVVGWQACHWRFCGRHVV